MERKIKYPRRRGKSQREKYDISTNPSDLYEAYQRLATAIVEQACKDANGYYNGNTAGDNWNRARMGDYQREEVKKFFEDEHGLFVLCMPHTDGKAFYKRLMQNYEECGYYCSPDIALKKGDAVL